MTSQLSVAMFSDAYDDYTLELVNAVAPKVKRLRLVQPENPKRFPVTELASAVEALRIPKPRIRDPRGLAAGRSFSKALAGVDVVHLQQSGDPSLNPWFLTLKRGVPVVMTVHDVKPHPGDGTYRKGAHTSQRLLARRVSKFIVHSENLASDLCRVWKVAEERVAVIQHGELGSLYRRRAGQESAVRRTDQILFFGRRWPYKGLDVLFAALNDRTVWAGDPLTLVIAGSGAPIDKLLDDAPSWLTVRLIDRYLTAAEVVRHFDEAALVCLPYLEASQSGVATLALGLGTPIVSTTVGGLGELLGSGIAALVEPDDPPALASTLRSVLADPNGANQRAMAGLQVAAGELSWQSVAAQHVAVYQQL